MLAKATRAGDPDAFATLYQRHAGRVREHVARWVPFPSLHEDFVQEIFTHAMAEIMTGRYRPVWTPEGFGAWLTGPVAAAVFAADKRAYWTAFKAGHEAAREVCGEIFNELRAARAASAPPASTADSIREHLAAEADTDAVRACLRAALAALAPECRRVLELRYLEGLSIEATAQVMGCDREYVRWLRQKAVGQLRTADLAPLRRAGGRRERKKARTAGTGSIFPLRSMAELPEPADGWRAAGVKSRTVAQELRVQITSGALGQPGGQLPCTRTLAARAGASRTTVERALSQLATEGAIYSQPRRGYFITPASGPARQAATRERWAGYMWATAADGIQRRRWVYGRSHDEVQAKWDRLHAEVTGKAAA